MNLETDNVTRQLTVPDILASATAAHDFTNISCDFTVETLFANGCVYLWEIQNSIDNLQDNVNIIAKTAASSVREMNFLPQVLLTALVVFNPTSEKVPLPVAKHGLVDLHYRAFFVNRNIELLNRMPMLLALSWFHDLMMTVNCLDLVSSCRPEEKWKKNLHRREPMWRRSHFFEDILLKSLLLSGKFCFAHFTPSKHSRLPSLRVHDSFVLTKKRF